MSQHACTCGLDPFKAPEQHAHFCPCFPAHLRGANPPPRYPSPVRDRRRAQFSDPKFLAWLWTRAEFSIEVRESGQAILRAHLPCVSTPNRIDLQVTRWRTEP